jgi:hypothetical protein
MDSLVSGHPCVPIPQARLYDYLFKSEEPGIQYERDAEGKVRYILVQRTAIPAVQHRSFMLVILAQGS